MTTAETQTPTPIDVVATIVAKPGRGDHVAALLANVLSTVRAEQGCLRYDLYRVRRDDETLMMLEQWASKEDLSAHGSAEHFVELTRRLGPELAGPPVVQVLDPVGRVGS